MSTCAKRSGALLAGLLLSLPAIQAAALGDPAPELQISEWTKGKAVKLAEGKGKTIYVVEFWATWCPPCRTSIPHLTKLQAKFKDKNVVFVGVSNEKATVVKPFVEKQGDKMEYVVAVDDNNRTSKAYMGAYGINGIPHAFIVDKEGRVVWHGHPMADLEKTLEQLVAGTYDLNQAKKRIRAEKLLEEYQELVADEAQADKAAEVAKELVALDKEVTGGIIPGRAFNPDEIRQQVRFNAAMQELFAAVNAGADAAKLDELTEAAKKLAPPAMDVGVERQKMVLQVAFMKYMRAAIGDDETKLADLGKELATLPCKDPQMLNQVAWTLLTEERIKHRDLPLATSLAKAAYDACDGKDAGVVDTYARALFDNGKTAEAITEQKKAIALCDDDSVRGDLEATLKRYEAKAAGQ